MAMLLENGLWFLASYVSWMMIPLSFLALGMFALK
jgi:hypothetical protein